MKKLLLKCDIPLLIITIIYSILGLVMIFSSSSITSVLRYGVSPSYFFIKQLIFLLVAYFVGFFIILRFPTKKYRVLIPIIMVFIIASLVFVLVKGTLINNAKSWFDLGFVSIQPTEFAKSAIIVYMAIYFGKIKEYSNQYAFLRPLIVGILIVVLIAMQPDLGGAAITAGIIFFVFLGLPSGKNNKAKFLKVLGITAIIGAIFFLYSGNEFLNKMQSSRLEFKNPCSRYTDNSGYQVCNGLIAVSNGGLFGLGLGNSTQKYLYLPEAHTDFIFPIIAEELGAIVASLVIIGYGFILFRLLKIAKESETLRGSIIAYGTFWFILLHIIINLCGVLALVPLTGVPLPFLSYGGSFNFNILIMLFIVQRICVENKVLKTKKEIEKL